jgi:hypothetical protein
MISRGDATADLRDICLLGRLVDDPHANYPTSVESTRGFGIPADLYTRIGAAIGEVIAWGAIAMMVWAIVSKWV